MSQESAAARISEETQQFVRRVRRFTQRKFTPEEKVTLVARVRPSPLPRSTYYN